MLQEISLDEARDRGQSIIIEYEQHPNRAGWLLVSMDVYYHKGTGNDDDEEVDIKPIARRALMTEEGMRARVADEAARYGIDRVAWLEKANTPFVADDNPALDHVKDQAQYNLVGTFAVENISVSISRSAEEVYRFASVPANFSKWAAGLGNSLKEVDGQWAAETPQGKVKLRFTEPNGFGVLDHYVTPKADREIYIPLRVVANGSGSEITLTLFRLPGMSDEQFAEDARTVKKDLFSLKRLLEG